MIPIDYKLIIEMIKMSVEGCHFLRKYLKKKTLQFAQRNMDKCESIYLHLNKHHNYDSEKSMEQIFELYQQDIQKILTLSFFFSDDEIISMGEEWSCFWVGLQNSYNNIAKTNTKNERLDYQISWWRINRIRYYFKLFYKKLDYLYQNKFYKGILEDPDNKTSDLVLSLNTDSIMNKRAPTMKYQQDDRRKLKKIFKDKKHYTIVLKMRFMTAEKTILSPIITYQVDTKEKEISIIDCDSINWKTISYDSKKQMLEKHEIFFKERFKDFKIPKFDVETIDSQIHNKQFVSK